MSNNSKNLRKYILDQLRNIIKYNIKDYNLQGETITYKLKISTDKFDKSTQSL